MIALDLLELCEIRLPLREPFRISSGVTEARRALLVRVRDREGAEGWGECAAGERPHYSAETVDTAWLAITRWIAPLVLGRSFDGPTDLYDALDADMRGHRMARAAVEMAVWDLAARRDRMSLSELLGGTRRAVPTGISLGLQRAPARLAELAHEAVCAGYRRIKVKIAPGRDRTELQAVRAAIGSDVPLTADANGAYRPTETDRLTELDAFDLTMLEQPFESDDLLRHAVLQRRLTTPICLDESITSPDRAADMIALRSGKLINIKPGRVGGHTAARAIHDLATAHDVQVWCGGMLETGIGRAHNVALASLPGFELPGDLSPSARYWDRDIVNPAWTMHDGMLTVPRDRTGIGVDLDLDYVDHCAVRREQLRSPSAKPHA